jgi:hypothetical protein
MAGYGKMIGAGLGGVAGGVFGGPVGAGIGVGLGGMVGGMFDGDMDQPDGHAYDAQWSPELLQLAKEDYDRQLEVRQRQEAQEAELQAVLAGKRGPRASELQMRKALSISTADAQTAAASARGGGGAQILAQRQAQQQAAAGSQDVAEAAAIMRTKEDAQLRQEISQGQAIRRQQDLAGRQGTLSLAQADIARQQGNGQISAGIDAGYRAQQQALMGSLMSAGAGLAGVGLQNGNTWGGKPGAPAGGPAPAPAPAAAPWTGGGGSQNGMYAVQDVQDPWGPGASHGQQPGLSIADGYGYPGEYDTRGDQGGINHLGEVAQGSMYQGGLYQMGEPSKKSKYGGALYDMGSESGNPFYDPGF